jgi:hypothetical protein
MDKELEQNPGDTGEQAGSAVGGTTVGAISRRRFARGAVVTSAVVASLGNRAAWAGKAEPVPVCISDAGWLSYQAQVGSLNPGTLEQGRALEKALKNPNMEQVSIDGQQCAVEKVVEETVKK